MIPQFDLAAVERGVPLSAFDGFIARSRLAPKELQDVVISARALKRRREHQKTLNVNESDRLAQVAWVFALAVRILGTPRRARQWLRNPAIQFAGKPPLALLRTGTGGHAVKQGLSQIKDAVQTQGIDPGTLADE
jgi:putative toxin-antitoxin system antitoxin component (TIGR02293 family)